MYCEIWISFPTFLVQPPEEWSKDPIDGGSILSHDPEIKTALVNMVEAKEEFDSVSYLIDYFSTWTQLKKAVARILCLKIFLTDLGKKMTAAVFCLFWCRSIRINRG